MGVVKRLYALIYDGIDLHSGSKPGNSLLGERIMYSTCKSYTHAGLHNNIVACGRAVWYPDG